MNLELENEVVLVNPSTRPAREGRRLGGA